MIYLLQCVIDHKFILYSQYDGANHFTNNGDWEESLIDITPIFNYTDVLTDVVEWWTLDKYVNAKVIATFDDISKFDDFRKSNPEYLL